MVFLKASQRDFKLVAYIGDFKTLLAFDFEGGEPQNLAGFSIEVQPEGRAAYFLWNTLQLGTPPAKDPRHPQEPLNSTLYAPIQKFRWLHVPGQFHQALAPAQGDYRYTVTPRFFDAAGKLLPLNDQQSATLSAVPVRPFKKGPLSLGFTRGFTQSQAFAHNFGVHALLRPAGNELLFDTNAVAGTNPEGIEFKYKDEYEWSGSTARQQVLDFLDGVVNAPDQFLQAFCYDLAEPDVCAKLLTLAAQGRLRIILDNAKLHQSEGNKTSPEDAFQQLFNAQAKAPSAILRGRFGRYAHDKVFVAFTREKPLRVLTGSTNFSITGMYVNSNHVLVFDDEAVARTYGELFEAAWAGEAHLAPFLRTTFTDLDFVPGNPALKGMKITFAPHTKERATSILQGVADRVEAEKTQRGKQSVLFAVMEMAKSQSPVLDVLKKLPEQTAVFTYGITDSDDKSQDASGYRLYKPGSAEGVIVTGKPGSAILPPPFDQIRFVSGIGHQIHHKFVVCGFNGPDPTVFCGSSNLAVGGESSNGDNLLEIHDGDVATAFAIEAMGLIDHFMYLNVLAEKKSPAAPPVPKMPADKSAAAQQAGWHLAPDGAWAKGYFNPDDLKCVERVLFSA
jgi:hypothetical protein